MDMSFKYKFSIIMAIYNTEDYLEQALGSVFNQTLNFEDNVQLILVDDCSYDNSREIIKKYYDKYPNNIECVFLEKNGGQAHARNVGMKYIQGRYVNFLDSDDYLEDNVLEEVYKFFIEHEDMTDIVSVPIQFFEKMTTPHILNKKFNKNRVIDLEIEANNPQLSASSAFFKSELFSRYDFPTDVIFSEDSIMINKILLEKKTLGVINTAKYYYRRRADSSSTIDTSTSKKEYYIEKLENYFINLINYCLEKEGEVPEYIQYMLAYDLQWTLKQPILELNSDEEKKLFWKHIDFIIEHLDIKTIKNNQYVTYDIFKPYFIYLKNKYLHYDIYENNVQLRTNDYIIDSLRNHKIWIDIVKIENNILNISGFMNSFFNSNDLSICAVIIDEKGHEKWIVGDYVKYTSRKDVTFLSRKWHFKYNFDIRIPIKDYDLSRIKIAVNFHIDANLENFSKKNLVTRYLTLDFSRLSNMSKTCNYLIKDSIVVLFESNMFKIYPYKYKSLVKREFNVLKNILKTRDYKYKEAAFIHLIYLIIYPFMMRLKKNKTICIYMDRIEAGDDNASHLFKYANTIDDDARNYYALNKDANEYESLSQTGKMLSYASFKHKIIYLFADKIISSHPYQSVINPFFEYNHDVQKLYNGLSTYNIYFLQHGVTLGNISGWLSKFDKNLSLIATVSQEEHDSFLTEGYNYDENIIQILGFPRFDNLETSDNKQILIIPSWRKYLRGNESYFINSEYFKTLESLLNNDKLIKLAKDNGYKIVFRAHPELIRRIGDSEKRYIDLLEIDDYVIVSEDESYQKLFMESSIMITDYSSVFFDFAYLKKALIYYQVEDDYHYDESYFDFERMGFGDVIKDDTELIEKIQYYIANDCELEDKYKKRVDDFFVYTDKNNCMRVYDWINNH